MNKLFLNDGQRIRCYEVKAVLRSEDVNLTTVYVAAASVGRAVELVNQCRVWEVREVRMLGNFCAISEAV